MNKGLSLAFLIILIHLHLCRASSSSSSSSWKVNAKNYKEGCVGEDCLIGNELFDSEFLLSSHTARMLYDVSQSQTGKTSNRNGAAVNCPQNSGYRSCLPSKNPGNKQPCADYTRNC